MRQFHRVEKPAAAVIKHSNPCGCGEADDIGTALERAMAGDPQSAFGGIVALNRPVDAATAEGLASLFLEVVVAPGFQPEVAFQSTGPSSCQLSFNGKRLPAVSLRNWS